jgi:hypothetical protein
MDLQAAFEDDLRRWLARIYERVELLARHEEHAAVESVLERENRLLTVLIVILGASIMLLPLAGGTFMIAALILLYTGAFGSSWVTLMKIRRLERSSARYHAIREQREAAWHNRPAIGPDERAQLIRLINLSQLTNNDRTRAAFASELLEARRSRELAGWQVLSDAEVLVRDPPPARHDE